MMRKHNQLLSLVRREDGGALAELAILVPFLVVMLGCVAEFGRYFQNYTTLSKATRASARYLSNHELNALEIGRAQALVLCGKLTCAGNDPPLVSGFTSANICMESSGSPKILNVTVRIPRTSDCNPMAGTTAGTPFTYRPIFNIGAILGTPSFSMALPIAPGTTMYYMID